MPANPRKNPSMALFEIAVRERTSTIITSHNGNVAPMMEPRPAEIYFNPQVERVLLKTKFKRVSIKTVNHSIPLGMDLPFEIKNMK